MISYLDDIKGLKINGEFLGNNIVFPHPLHYHTYGSDVDGAFSQNYNFTRFGISRLAPSGNCNTLANSIRVTPILVDRPVEIFGFRITIGGAAVSGTLLRMAIYKDNGNGYPSTMLQGTNVGDIDVFALASSAQIFMYKSTVRLEAGLYWIARVSNGTAGINGAGNTTSVPVLGKSPVNNQSNDNLGYNVNFTFAALPQVFPSTYTSMLVPIPAQLPLPEISFVIKMDTKIERFSEMSMLSLARLNKQNPQGNIKIFSMLQHRKHDKNCYFSNAWNGATTTFTQAANVFRGMWVLINQTISFDEIRAENTTSTSGALFSVAIYSMKPRNHRRGTNTVKTYFPDKLVLEVNGFDASTTGVKSRVIKRMTLKRGLYCFGMLTNASLQFKGLSNQDIPADAVYYGFSQTYGSFPYVFPTNTTINPIGVTNGIFIAMRPA